MEVRGLKAENKLLVLFCADVELLSFFVFLVSNGRDWSGKLKGGSSPGEEEEKREK